MASRCLLLTAVLALAAPTRASGAGNYCARTPADWSVIRGTLGQTASCGAWVLATDASAARYSYGELELGPAVVPFELMVTMRRLSGDSGHSLEIGFMGRWLMVKDGAWGVYLNEPQFNADGWHAQAGLDTHREHTVVVTRLADEVRVRLDGKDLGAWPLSGAPAAGSARIGFKGMGGYRARMRFRDVSVRALPAAATQP